MQHMDASILIVGDDGFSNSIRGSIGDLGRLTIEVAPDIKEATPIIQAQQPDVLIMQTGQDPTLELCQTIKKQSRLAWIYCLVINDLDVSQEQRSIDQRETLTSEALERGVDAYLWLTMPLRTESAQTRLLRSHVQAGLRRVHSYRELVRANDLLSAIALADPLTELNNRRAFEWELPRQINNARDRQLPISLIMLDVDFFKAINDQYGHLVGDRALKLISARLRHNLRFYDTPFRYGGEEFVIILNNTSPVEAKLIGQRLCQLIADQAFAIDSTLDLWITVSAGTASLRPDDDDRGLSLLNRADQHLLMAKSQGRNQVVSAEEFAIQMAEESENDVEPNNETEPDLD